MTGVADSPPDRPPPKLDSLGRPNRGGKGKPKGGWNKRDLSSPTHRPLSGQRLEPPPPGGRKGGRPRIDVNIDQLRSCAALDLTIAETASVLRVSVDTVIARFKIKRYRNAWDEGKASGTARIKRVQWDLLNLYESLYVRDAEGKVVSAPTPADRAISERMARWLGIQRLGQRVGVDVAQHIQHDHRHLVAGRVDMRLDLSTAQDLYASTLAGGPVSAIPQRALRARGQEDAAPAAADAEDGLV